MVDVNYQFSYDGTSFHFHQTFVLNPPPVINVKPVVSLPDTLAECEHELDIIRGRIPTPKGYKVDIERTKLLMARVKELS